MSWLPPAPKSAQSKVIPSPSNVPSNRRISRRAVLALAGIGVGAAAIPAAIHFWPSKTLPPVDPSKSSTDRWRAWRTFEYQPEFSDLNRRDGIFAVAMSPDGRQAAVGFGDLVRPHVNPGFVRLLDLQSGHWREIGRLKSAVSRIAFVGDGQTVVATSGVLTHGVEVSGFGDVLVRDLAKYEARTISLELERLNCLAVDSYGKWAIVAGTLGRLRRIALDDGRVLSSFDEPFKTNITALAVAADGSRVAVGYRTGAVDIREADDLRRRSIEFPVSKEQLAAMTGLGFRYDCKELVGTTRKLEGDRSQIRIWNLANSKPISVIAESESDIRAMDLAADGQSLATGTQDGMLRIWNMTEQRIVFEERAHNEPVFALSFAADGLTLASCSTDATVRLWVRE
jgi:WD40 repeat protein